MCRLAAYLGPDIFISSLVTEPKHSLIHQSYQAKERVEPLNGDGFGIGWYAPTFCDAPAVFKDVSPAWSNLNLRDIARVTKSGCIFAHVRAATVGGQSSRANCHPFSWNKYLFMHNGTLFEFARIRRELRRGLSDEAYDMIKGATDSEHVFTMIIDRLRTIDSPTVEDMGNAMVETICEIEKLKKDAGVTAPSTLNLILADGARVVACRYVSFGEDSNSLYFSESSSYSCENGLCRMTAGSGAVLIVSERLDASPNWQKVRNNHLILVDENKELRQRAIRL